jgi:nitrogen fixation/metabolism regulation signal transduction histidine kinase
LLICQTFELTQYISKTNTELLRFFDAIRHSDFSQRFELKQLGSGYDELGSAFTDALKNIQSIRSAQEQKLIHLKTIVEHVPVPLMSLSQQRKVTLLNNSARRLFGCHNVSHLNDLAQFNSVFTAKLPEIISGHPCLINMKIDDMEHKLIISATKITTNAQQETLISMQDIQNELTLAQLQAWQDLVSVLTHEIMNSITPVASLAKTAVDLVEDLQKKNANTDDTFPDIEDDLADVLAAMQTVARRSDGLMKFVSSYRQLTRLPEANKKNTRVTKLFDHILPLSTQLLEAKGIMLDVKVSPSTLEVNVDSDMLVQVLINLLHNAIQAFNKKESAEIHLNAFLNLRGHVVIEVADNGQGIDESNLAQIFVPFFTTKKEGSGVGLALTRQVMLAHGGNVSVRNNATGGVTFSLTFK